MASSSSFIGKDGLVHSFWVGDQNSKSVEEMELEIKPLINQLKKQGKEVLILADVTKLGKANLSSRQAGYKLLKNLDYKKTAIFGSFRSRGLVEAVILASGCIFKVKYFTDEKSAREWLLS